jgi:TM2 domain-containing membrane protein YozV
MELICPNCRGRFESAQQRAAGTEITCPSCHEPFRAASLLTVVYRPKAEPQSEPPAEAEPEAMPNPDPREARAASPARVCPFCTKQIKFEAKKCRYCRRALDPALRDAQQASRMAGSGLTASDPPNKLTAFLFAIFLGLLGAHKLYLGQHMWGVFYLLMNVLLGWTIIVPGVFVVICFIEGIVYLTYNDAEFARKYGRSRSG